jgi:threonine dehydrogenase-like Zn-dependent dehydrogenase
MKALRISESGFGVEETPIPSNNGEALVRVLLSGICNTDLELIKGYAGFQGTIGHEFVGIVEQAPTRNNFVGKRVVGEINAGCGKCSLCLGGDPRHCPDRTVLGIHGRDGTHAEYLQLPEINLLPVPDNVADEQAVFVEPLAAAFGIADSLDVQKGPIAVIGDGKLGILCARSLSLKSPLVTLVGKHRKKLDLAQSSNIDGVPLSDIVEIGKFDTVVEASGSASGFETALGLVKPKGTIVLKSTFHAPLTIDSSRIVVDEISIVGSRCGRFAPAIDLLAQEQVRVDDLISEEYPLQRAAQAIDHSGQSGVLKVLLRP